MMRTTLLGIAFLIAGVVTSGCENQGPLDSYPDPAFVAGGLELVKALPPQYEGDPTDAQVRQFVRSNLNWTVRLRRIINAASTWSEADAAIRTALEEPNTPEAQFFKEQAASGAMLKTYLIGGPQTFERLEATAYYTRMLVRNDSPEAGLVADALDALSGHLPTEEIQSLASAAAASGEKLLERRLDCEDCSFAELMRRMPAEVEQRSHTHTDEVAHGVTRLHTMVGASH